MSKMKRTVGVLGGMGPEATVLFMQKIVRAVPARDDDDHIPLLVDHNPQVPSRIRALIEKSGEDPGPALAAMARRLEQAGAEALVMPCNTAHNFRSVIANAVTVPFLSMIDLTVERLHRTFPGAKVGILASPAVRMTQIYEAPLAEAGLTPVYPSDEDSILSAIRALKISASDFSARAIVASAASELSTKGSTVLLVGCTEFSLLTQDLAQRHCIVDSLDILTEATVQFAHGDNSRRQFQDG